MKRTRMKLEIELRPCDLVDALRSFMNVDEFDHAVWSIWQAETLEHLASLIREGYAQKAAEAEGLSNE